VRIGRDMKLRFFLPEGNGFWCFSDNNRRLETHKRPALFVKKLPPESACQNTHCHVLSPRNPPNSVAKQCPSQVHALGSTPASTLGRPRPNLLKPCLPKAGFFFCGSSIYPETSDEQGSSKFPSRGGVPQRGGVETQCGVAHGKRPFNSPSACAIMPPLPTAKRSIL
jgi:hypothetical protein